MCVFWAGGGGGGGGVTVMLSHMSTYVRCVRVMHYKLSRLSFCLLWSVSLTAVPTHFCLHGFKEETDQLKRVRTPDRWARSRSQARPHPLSPNGDERANGSLRMRTERTKGTRRPARDAIAMHFTEGGGGGRQRERDAGAELCDKIQGDG